MWGDGLLHFWSALDRPGCPEPEIERLHTSQGLYFHPPVFLHALCMCVFLCVELHVCGVVRGQSGVSFPQETIHLFLRQVSHWSGSHLVD